MNTALTKESTSNDIKAYFEAVLELSNKNEQYPVNLEDVWPLVYSDKGHAVRALKGAFVQDVDYKEVTQNGNKVRSSFVYMLTVPCLEYFIAKKVRPVFEVYRKVFHKVADVSPMTTLQVLAQQSAMLAKSIEQMAVIEQQTIEIEKRTSTLEDKIKKIEEEREENNKLLLESELSAEDAPSMPIRSKIRMLVNEYCSATNTSQQVVWHEIYRQLYYQYHISINSYHKTCKESNLDVAERHGFISYIYTIVSSIVKKSRCA